MHSARARERGAIAVASTVEWHRSGLNIYLYPAWPHLLTHVGVGKSIFYDESIKAVTTCLLKCLRQNLLIVGMEDYYPFARG